MQDKRTDLKEAVSRYVTDGCSITLGSFVARSPMAVCYEIIRQGRRNLTLTTESEVEAGELFIAAGCLHRLECAYQWIGIAGGFNYRRAVEKGIPNYLEIAEYSNLGASARFMAGAMGLPFMMTKSMIGSDIITHNPHIKIMDDPYGSGEQLVLVPAAKPDVAFIHVQRADKMGNAQIWGMLGNDDVIARAAKHVVITCEEIIPTREIRKIPNMTAIPGYCVSAVVEVPFACHPNPVAGYYWMDFPFRRVLAKLSMTREGIVAWMDEWIHGVKDFEGYLNKVGADRLAKLQQLEQENYRIPRIETEEAGS
jgi:glutaconate CoA-transferase, subunit A